MLAWFYVIVMKVWVIELYYSQLVADVCGSTVMVRNVLLTDDLVVDFGAFHKVFHME